MADFMKPAPAPPTKLGRHRVLSSTAGIRVSPLALGTMNIGAAHSAFLGAMDKETAFKILDTYYDNGGNFIDTANNYQDEESEQWIGEWLSSRKNRDNVVIATKYTYQYQAYKSGPEPKWNNATGNHKRSLHVSVRDSLRKLQTDWIDILYLHFWDFTTSIEEVMDSLHILVQQGKVLYLGISDSPAWVVSAANYYAKAHGKTPFSVYQGRWNVMARDFERDIIPMALYFDMAVACWDVLGGGKLQSAKQLEERKKNNESLRSAMGSPEQSEEEKTTSRTLEQLGKEIGVDSVTAVALAYVRCKVPGLRVFPIIGGRKVEHLMDNIKSLDIQLSKEQIERLDSIKAFDVGFPGNFFGQDHKLTGKPGVMQAAFSTIDLSN